MRSVVVLRWIERLLVVAALCLATWCTAVLIQARYVAHIPVPASPAFARLPGEDLPEALPSAGTWVARLEVPSLALSATVLEGTDDRTLRRAAGHIDNTALPGAPGNVGIAGHRDTVFRPLRKVQIGDAVVLTTADEVLEYRVVRTMIVNPQDVYVLAPSEASMLTLVTCYPFTFIGAAPQRLIVRADLTSTTMRAGTKAKS